MKKTIALLLAVVLCVGALAGCGSGNGTPAASTPAASAEVKADAPAAEFNGEMKIGVVTYLTGTGKETGDRQVAAVKVAVDKVNAEGGVNGAKLVAEFFDCGSGQQEAINAVQLACNTEGLSGLVGMYQSAYAIAMR